MQGQLFILEPYNGMKSRYHCPSCQHREKTFSRYINTATGEHLHTTVGRCNRESNCSYHYTPKQYFQDNNISFETRQPSPVQQPKKADRAKPGSVIPLEVFKASLQRHEANYFVQFLVNRFGAEVAAEQVSRYFLATSKHWEGATVFWQIDAQGKVRAGKIMLYNPATGKRVKEPFSYIHWVHKVMKWPGFDLRQCLFGEHLLIDKHKPVAVVESEKTAVIASIYLPQFIWVAVGSLTNLNAEKCRPLKGRSVTLFPDLNGFEKWKSKANELSCIASVQVSDLLERCATDAEREQGLDLADYLLSIDIQDITGSEDRGDPLSPGLQPVVELEFEQQPSQYLQVKHPRRLQGNWEKEIAELEQYFSNIEMPAEPLKISPFSTISDCSLFVSSHLATLKTYNGQENFTPFLNRLQSLREYINTH